MKPILAIAMLNWLLMSGGAQLTPTSPADEAPRAVRQAMRPARSLALQAVDLAAPKRVADNTVVDNVAPKAPAHGPAVRVQTPGGTVLSIPGGCPSVSGGYGVVMHFHGAPPVVEKAFEQARVPAALLIFNWGIGSGPYEDRFAMAGSFDDMRERAHELISRHCPEAQRIERVAISAWSAGYGAAFRILAHPAEAEKVDAVLLADGLHTGFVNRRTRQVDPRRMAPFTAFAERAARGEAVFAITHSAIRTPSYASTTESADFVLEQAGAERVSDPATPDDFGMKLTSHARRGGLTVQGYAGGTADHHADHLHALGRTLFPVLASKWSAASTPLAS